MNYKDYLIRLLKKYKKEENIEIDPHAELKARQRNIDVEEVKVKGSSLLARMFYLVAPTAKDASLKDWGTAFTASSVVLTIVGNTMAAKASCPASNDIPKFKYKTRKANPNNPKTIEGVPFRLSMPARINLVIFPSLAYSDK